MGGGDNFTMIKKIEKTITKKASEFESLRGFTPYRFLPSEKGQTGGFLEKKGRRNVHKKIERRERIRCYGTVRVWW